MATRVSRYTTRELSPKTWPDFARLFETHPAPGAYPCWCMYNHRPGPVPARKQLQSSIERAARNRREKRARVESGCAHGILVYAEGEPVGWCQYGPRDELPRIDNNPRYTGTARQCRCRKLAREGGLQPLWRITCFVVDKRYRGRGVARVGLHAALAAIRKKGGGLVEAYPIVRWGAYSDYRGTVSMFRNEGFEIVTPLGKDNAVMQRTVIAA